MCSPRPNQFRDPAVETISPGKAHANRSARVDRPRCGCNCGCVCCNNDTNNKAEDSPLPTPIRGRSLTLKHDRTNSENLIEARPAPGGIDSTFYNTTPSVNGQEGLPLHQIERATPTAVDGIDTYANDSIQRWLGEDHVHEHPYCLSSSPNPSMRAEASTIVPSSASSGFLPARTATSDELTTFTYGGFEEPKAQTCAFTPLWLTHELRYCRNFRRGNVVENNSGYPGTIDFDDPS